MEKLFNEKNILNLSEEFKNKCLNFLLKDEKNL